MLRKRDTGHLQFQVLTSLGRVIAMITLCGGALCHAQPAWPMLGGGPERNSLTTEPLPSLAQLRWTRTTDLNGLTITFVANACPVTDGEIVLATGRVRPIGAPVDSHRLFAFDALSGAPLWHAVVPAPLTDSVSSPHLDAANQCAIHASGTVVSAFSTLDGSPLWQRPLARPIVNASPVITTDRGDADRLFITDYDGFGQLGSLYCINIDPFNAITNPFAPGALVWSAPIGGSSGNSPAYLPTIRGGNDRIFVASVGDFGFSGGVIFSFDIATGELDWATECPTSDGFFGGLCATLDVDAKPALFAATYAFFGNASTATLVKLDAVSGDVTWSTPCNRSQAIPAPLPDGRILLSGGISGFGSVPSLELFQDSGPTVMRQWHSALDTWFDADGDGTLDLGEYLRVGGWLQQPVVSVAKPQPAALVGVLPVAGSGFGASNELFAIDLTRLPTDPQFIAASASGAGGSASLAGGLAWSIGTAGLRCFGTPSLRPDVDGNGFVNIDDLAAWEQGLGRRDVDRSGTINAADRAALISTIREFERSQLTGAM